MHDLLSESRRGEVPADLFGPAVEVPPDASIFQRAFGPVGRIPTWTAAGATDADGDGRTSHSERVVRRG